MGTFTFWTFNFGIKKCHWFYKKVTQWGENQEKWCPNLWVTTVHQSTEQDNNPPQNCEYVLPAMLWLKWWFECFKKKIAIRTVVWTCTLKANGVWFGGSIYVPCAKSVFKNQQDSTDVDVLNVSTDVVIDWLVVSSCGSGLLVGREPSSIWGANKVQTGLLVILLSLS